MKKRWHMEICYRCVPWNFNCYRVACVGICAETHQSIIPNEWLIFDENASKGLQISFEISLNFALKSFILYKFEAKMEKYSTESWKFQSGRESLFEMNGSFNNIRSFEQESMLYDVCDVYVSECTKWCKRIQLFIDIQQIEVSASNSRNRKYFFSFVSMLRQ